MLTSCIVFLTFLPARYPAVAQQLRPDKQASSLIVPPLIPRCDLHEAINGNVANPYCVPSTFDEHGPPVQDRFARWSHGRKSMRVPKLPLVDVASQILGAEGPAGGGSRSSTLQAEMEHFDHEALGDEEEEPARNNVQNNPVTWRTNICQRI